ncbi:Serine/threonine-protein kinase HipA [Hydrogenovibrio crunogenus]|uniref:Serine/threonine-protein kinase HipA n=1 Tax=Hydrogenovibrio crunogenus TaxID=39765 RepID=A0A4P7P176_9GAMM|nr:type II toxin-antitoxin system HipA family toxin [Hydrogenovibrio crunogenus]QBZ83847.1 Serine/threonine-protein kinase HipA [Hydrogenovibrio crunogenus]
MTKRHEDVAALRITLQGVEIGVLTHYTGGKNILTFSPDYIAIPEYLKPTISLRQIITKSFVEKPIVSNQKIMPILSNLLPEGALREWMAKSLKTHPDNEFALMAYAGKNLTGGIIAIPISKGEIPPWALDSRQSTDPVQINVTAPENKFSLAGIQMKFSSKREDGRFLITDDTNGDSWIIKTPSTQHKNVPENEFTAMTLAKIAGIEIPEIKLIKLSDLDNLPDIKLPDEEFAYAIKRFDRKAKADGFQRLHTEDFAQILNLYPTQKYDKVNYEQMGLIIKDFSQKGLFDVQQFAKRLLINILLGNGDAHIKNWSMIYHDQQTPQLSPAYDILSTMVYIHNERDLALNMAKNKDWYAMSFEHFKSWAERIDVNWSAIKVHLDETMNIARTRWLEELNHLPMIEQHKSQLKEHWAKLHPDFRI